MLASASPRHVLALHVLLAGTSIVAWSPSSHAQTRRDGAAAQALFDDARALMLKGDYAAACPKLEESQRLDPGSGTLINLGDCYEHEGRLASAWSTFLDAASAARANGNEGRERVAREHAAALEPRLARLTIRVDAENTPGLEIRRDGLLVRSGQWGTAIPTDEGLHTIIASAPGRKAWDAPVTIRDGAKEVVQIPELDVAPTSSTEGSARRPAQRENSAERLGTQRIAALAAGGLGVAGLVLGSVYGLRSISKRAESDETCAGSSCADRAGKDLMDDAILAGNVSTAAFVVGGVGLALGGVLWFTARRPAGAARFGVGVGTVAFGGAW